jgi:hypothetical protein
MKYLMIALALAGVTITASAFAQSDPSTITPPSAAMQLTSKTTSVVSQDGQWVPPNGQPVAGKTRAQVYQELVQAQQDGQIAYLHSTIYAHH